VRHWPGSALASELSRRLASAHSPIVSAGGGVRIASALRAAWIRRCGPFRIRGRGDREAAKLRERFGDGLADARARPRNSGLLVDERGEPIGQNQKPRSQSCQDSDPGFFHLSRRQQIAAPGACVHLREIGLGFHQPRPLNAKVRGAGLGTDGLFTWT
jgi:hypothetical protein